MGSPFTGPDALHEEIARLTGIGMSNHEAIQAATLQGARAIGVEDDLGTVRPGRRADLLVLDGDPLADISAAARHRCRTARSASALAVEVASGGDASSRRSDPRQHRDARWERLRTDARNSTC